MPKEVPRPRRASLAANVPPLPISPSVSLRTPVANPASPGSIRTHPAAPGLPEPSSASRSPKRDHTGRPALGGRTRPTRGPAEKRQRRRTPGAESGDWGWPPPLDSWAAAGHRSWKALPSSIPIPVPPPTVRESALHSAGRSRVCPRETPSHGACGHSDRQSESPWQRNQPPHPNGLATRAKAGSPSTRERTGGQSSPASRTTGRLSCPPPTGPAGRLKMKRGHMPGLEFL